MTAYRYTDATNTVAHVIDADGVSRSSMLASTLPEGVEVLPYVAPPPAVPASVTMRQARLALLGAGKLAAVAVALDSLPEPARTAALIEWEYSNEVLRHNGFVSQLAPGLGLSEAQLDALFVAAAAL